MRKRRLVWAVILVGSVGLTLCAIGYPILQPLERISFARFNRIAKGMTEPQVDQVLGGPADREGGPTIPGQPVTGPSKVWAFEMERRSAQEVVAIDIPDATQWDWPQPPPVFDSGCPRNDETFLIAHRALNSRVQHRDLSVYDLHPDSVGFFDFAFIGTLLIHLRDPVRALVSVKRVLRGQLLVTDQISLTLTLLRPGQPAADLAGVTGVPFWCTPNTAGLRRMIEAAGYQILSTGGPYFLKPGPRPVQQSWWVRHIGLPHAWVLGKAGP